MWGDNAPAQAIDHLIKTVRHGKYLELLDRGLQEILVFFKMASPKLKVKPHF